ncbi:hypothetical protein IGS68_21535 [Skermanella sp. TT6]|uniref:Major capsid protein n=1 Tax=Skermanella cutis TaxID=2775420 RepID=A0ABX7B398_9PROT|nr:phage capsid protein [Skermanella sp. TT6]QQP88583.1 hypothetical protein IGS68_21535 [Skermanella sp. TT6]
MSSTIDRAFVKQFEREVHESFQRMGSKLRNTVRSKGDVRGASTIFQKVGKGVASPKARHGTVPVMNIDHAPVECILTDYYAGDWVDKLDELKTNIDERSVITNAGAYALGRKTDDLIIAQLDTSVSYAGLATDGLTKAKVLAAFETLGQADVPDDGQRYAVVGWKQWSQLLGIEEFAKSDYVGPDELPWRGTQAKRWLGTLWIPHSGLTLNGNVRLCHWYHKTAVGHAAGADVTTDVTWHGDRASHFVNNMMSQGACLIDTSGVVTLRCLEN